MAKKIYSILGFVALAIMIYLVSNPQRLSHRSLIWITTILYAVAVGCIHGIVAHSLNAKQKGSLMLYPVFMGILFGVLAFIYIFIILPLVIPGFM